MSHWFLALVRFINISSPVLSQALSFDKNVWSCVEELTKPGTLIQMHEKN
jgi:hypothetical protein